MRECVYFLLMNPDDEAAALFPSGRAGREAATDRVKRNVTEKLPCLRTVGLQLKVIRAREETILVCDLWGLQWRISWGRCWCWGPTAPQSRCGSLTEVFHLKCQNNFLTCRRSVLGVSVSRATSAPQCSSWHMKPVNPESPCTGPLRPVCTLLLAFWPHRHEKDANLHLRQKAREGISVFMLRLSCWATPSFLVLFFLCVRPCSNQRSKGAAALEALELARASTPCVTICNIIKKSALCFIQPITANQCEPAGWWEVEELELRGLVGPRPSVLLISLGGPGTLFGLPCLDKADWFALNPVIYAKLILLIILFLKTGQSTLWHMP